ncbi:MAG: ATP-dependent Clp protease proteolytic subunit [Prevotellaceae bacterium]|jgi:ATP-dependent protease ClpP protease subunit|nr:ATP-dependent Clp protease proteolytic subunit [Prevotellaceae bacterium]
MPNWSEILVEIQQEQAQHPNANPLDTVRRKYLQKVTEISGRNAIAYYSGWLQKPQVHGTSVNDKDKSGFMLTIHKLDRTKGLDLILHTPGGDIAATESLVDYLYAMFGCDIRVIVPQISMSAGTMIAMAAKEIVMGKHSNLGPIDPQIGGVACQAILNEFQHAKDDIRQNPHAAPLWQVIVGKYHPTFLGMCRQAIEWSEEITCKWLKNNMCKGDAEKANSIIKAFANHTEQKSHARHISKEQCKSVGLNISDLEANPDFQDAILTTHHAFMHTFTNTFCVKIIENHNGTAYIEQVSAR